MSPEEFISKHCTTTKPTTFVGTHDFLPPEKDPFGKSPHESGAKLDQGKATIRRGLLEYFPRACLEIAKVSAFGASKYAWGGWVEVPDGINRYGDAGIRHICRAAIEGEIDPDSGLAHKAHEAWNALAVLEKFLQEQEEKTPEKFSMAR
jgi:hypothetical protein